MSEWRVSEWPSWPEPGSEPVRPTVEQIDDRMAFYRGAYPDELVFLILRWARARLVEEGAG